MKRFQWFSMVAAMVLSWSVLTAAEGPSSMESHFPTAIAVKQRIEKILGRKVQRGETVAIKNNGVAPDEMVFAIAPEIQTVRAPGCDYYDYWFVNFSGSPCDLVVESISLWDPAYAGQDDITLNVTVHPGTLVSGSFPVSQCATEMTVRYQYPCGAQVLVVQSLSSNWGDYGFLWSFHYINYIAPPVSTIYINGANSDFCTEPFVNGVCSSPPDSLEERVAGGSNPPASQSSAPVPALTQMGIVGLILTLVGASVWILWRRRTATTT